MDTATQSLLLAQQDQVEVLRQQQELFNAGLAMQTKALQAQMAAVADAQARMTAQLGETHAKAMKSHAAQLAKVHAEAAAAAAARRAEAEAAWKSRMAQQEAHTAALLQRDAATAATATALAQAASTAAAAAAQASAAAASAMREQAASLNGLRTGTTGGSTDHTGHDADATELFRSVGVGQVPALHAGVDHDASADVTNEDVADLLRTVGVGSPERARDLRGLHDPNAEASDDSESSGCSNSPAAQRRRARCKAAARRRPWAEPPVRYRKGWRQEKQRESSTGHAGAPVPEADQPLPLEVPTRAPRVPVGGTPETDAGVADGREASERDAPRFAEPTTPSGWWGDDQESVTLPVAVHETGDAVRRHVNTLAAPVALPPSNWADAAPQRFASESPSRGVGVSATPVSRAASPLQPPHSPIRGTGAAAALASRRASGRSVVPNRRATGMGDARDRRTERRTAQTRALGSTGGTEGTAGGGGGARMTRKGRAAVAHTRSLRERRGLPGATATASRLRHARLDTTPNLKVWLVLVPLVLLPAADCAAAGARSTPCALLTRCDHVFANQQRFKHEQRAQYEGVLEAYIAVLNQLKGRQQASKALPPPLPLCCRWQSTLFLIGHNASLPLG